MNWKDHNVTAIICYCRNVTKRDIIVAINEGARNLDDIRDMTGACLEERCKFTNPTGRPCSSDVQEMLDYYAPMADALRHR